MREKLRILVVDNNVNMARTLVDILKLEGYEAEAVHSGPEALAKIIEVPFNGVSPEQRQGTQDWLYNCVLSDIKMPGMDGVELYKAIRARRPDLPMVLMTAYSTDRLVKEGLEAGVIAALTKPLNIDLLLIFFSFLWKECSIVIVDDDPRFCETLGDILRVRGFTVTQIINPHEVMERLGGDEKVVLLDMKLNDISGLEVLQKIRVQHPHLPVVLVTGYREQMAPAIKVALTLNAYTCLYKPLEIEELIKLLTQIYHQELGKVLKT